MTATTAIGVRAVELPPCRMCMAAGEDLPAFNTWWSAIDAKRTDKFYPRDFMYHDPGRNQLVWLYPLPPEATAACPYPSIEFAGGLYGVAVSRAEDDVDGGRVYRAIQEWVKETNAFVLDEGSERRTLFHVITSDATYQKLRYRQIDIYVPIR
jgi:hypothetical protein